MRTALPPARRPCGVLTRRPRLDRTKVLRVQPLVPAADQDGRDGLFHGGSVAVSQVLGARFDPEILVASESTTED